MRRWSPGDVAECVGGGLPTAPFEGGGSPPPRPADFVYEGGGGSHTPTQKKS